MDVCIKKKSGLRQDGTPPQKMEQVWRCEVMHRLQSNFSPLHVMYLHFSFADGTKHAACFEVVRNFQVRTSVSWTVHLLPLFSL